MSASKTIVVKIGGNALGPDDTTFHDLVALQNQGVSPVVVHGGGPAVTRWLKELGVETTFVRGLRVTDDATLAVVTAVLGGLVNKTIVAAIQAAGGRAVGLSGADGPTVLAQIRNPDLGRVGEVSRVDSTLLDSLLEQGMIPVLAPVSMEEGPEARLINVNADSIAGAIAHALKAERVVFLTDVPGVLGGDGELLPVLSDAQIRDLVDREVITGGMVPKVEACLTALQHVAAAQIIDGRKPGALLEAVADRTGTKVRRDAEEISV